MERNRRVRLMQPILNEQMVEAAVNALRKDRFLRGESVMRFEEEFAKYIGTKYALATNSGTSSLLLSLIAVGVKAGDYVITTPATFIATANAIVNIGAKPIFVDISLETYNVDPQKLEEMIKKYKDKVKAIVPVHLYGYPCEMDAISEIAERYDVKVLEDACQAHGALYQGKRVGSLGDTGAFSFYPSKNMTVCGDGGMVTTNDDKIAEVVKSLRDVGRSVNNPYFHERIGYTARMNSINAAIGRIQLKYLEDWNEKINAQEIKYCNWVLDLLNAKCGERILDVACGKGALVYTAEKRGLESFGVDISEVACRLAKRDTQTLRLVVGDAENLPFRKQ